MTGQQRKPPHSGQNCTVLLNFLGAPSSPPFRFHRPTVTLRVSGFRKRSEVGPQGLLLRVPLVSELSWFSGHLTWATHADSKADQEKNWIYLVFPGSLLRTITQYHRTHVTCSSPSVYWSIKTRLHRPHLKHHINIFHEFELIHVTFLPLEIRHFSQETVPQREQWPFNYNLRKIIVPQKDGFFKEVLF